jgi:hypothetical protein
MVVALNNNGDARRRHAEETATPRLAAVRSIDRVTVPLGEEGRDQGADFGALMMALICPLGGGGQSPHITVSGVMPQ